jgi:hypothetical protein
VSGRGGVGKRARSPLLGSTTKKNPPLAIEGFTAWLDRNRQALDDLLIVVKGDGDVRLVRLR